MRFSEMGERGTELGELGLEVVDLGFGKLGGKRCERALGFLLSLECGETDASQSMHGGRVGSGRWR